MSTEQRITRLLATVAPLTPKQIFRALAIVDIRYGQRQLVQLYDHHALCRVACSPAQRRLSGGIGSAYALNPVRPLEAQTC